jgi:hypothetical protein
VIVEVQRLPPAVENKAYKAITAGDAKASRKHRGVFCFLSRGLFGSPSLADFEAPHRDGSVLKAFVGK